jgi:deoxyribodipyrimidine photo-lyase
MPNIQQPIELDLSALAQTDIHQLQVEYAEKIKPPMTALWNVGESHAHNLLDHFIDQNLTDYKVSRDLPSISGTSQLSTYLNIGILSIRQCIQALFRQQHGDFVIQSEGQQTWLDELLWREFYQHILFDFPQVSKHLPFKAATQKSIGAMIS